MVMFTNNQQSGVQQSATASAPTTVPGTDQLLTNVLQVIQGVATQDLQNIQVEANKRGGEFEEAILRAQQQLEASNKIVVEGVAKQQEMVRAQEQLSLAEVDDDLQISETTRKTLADVDKAIQQTQAIADDQLASVEDLTNYVEGKDKDGKPSFWRKVATTLFPDEIRRRRDNAVSMFAERQRDKGLLEQTKSQVLSNAAAQSALLTQAEATAKKGLVKAKSVVDVWNVAADAQTKRAALAKEYAGLSSEVLKNVNQKFEMARQTGAFNVDVANMIIQREAISAQTARFKQDTQFREKWMAKNKQFNDLYGATMDGELTAELAATGQWERFDAIADPETSKHYQNFMFYGLGTDKRKDFKDMYNAPESEYTPEVRRAKIQAANFLRATGQDKTIESSLEKRINDAKAAGIAVDAKTQELWRKEETEKVLQAVDGQRFSLAGQAALNGGEIILGEQQWIEKGIDPAIAKEIVKRTPSDLKSGKVRDPETLYTSTMELTANMEADYPGVGDTLAEVLPAIFKEQVMNSVNRNYPDLFGSDNLMDTSLTASSGNSGILGLDSPIAGGTGEAIKLDFTDPLGFRNGQLLYKAQQRIRGALKTPFNPPRAGDVSNLQSLTRQIQNTQGSR